VTFRLEQLCHSVLRVGNKTEARNYDDEDFLSVDSDNVTVSEAAMKDSALHLFSVFEPNETTISFLLNC